MNKPEKKENYGQPLSGVIDQAEQAIGYNKACDEWQAYCAELEQRHERERKEWKDSCNACALGGIKIETYSAKAELSTIKERIRKARGEVLEGDRAYINSEVLDILSKLSTECQPEQKPHVNRGDK